MQIEFGATFSLFLRLQYACKVPVMFVCLICACKLRKCEGEKMRLSPYILQMDIDNGNI